MIEGQILFTPSPTSVGEGWSESKRYYRNDSSGFGQRLSAPSPTSVGEGWGEGNVKFRCSEPAAITMPVRQIQSHAAEHSVTQFQPGYTDLGIFLAILMFTTTGAGEPQFDRRGTGFGAGELLLNFSLAFSFL